MHTITKPFSPNGIRVIPAGEYKTLTEVELAAARRLGALGPADSPGATNKAERVPAARQAKRGTKG